MSLNDEIKLTLSRDMVAQAVAEYCGAHNLIPGQGLFDVSVELKDTCEVKVTVRPSARQMPEREDDE